MANVTKLCTRGLYGIRGIAKSTSLAGRAFCALLMCHKRSAGLVKWQLLGLLIKRRPTLYRSSTTSWTCCSLLFDFFSDTYGRQTRKSQRPLERIPRQNNREISRFSASCQIFMRRFGIPIHPIERINRSGDRSLLTALLKASMIGNTMQQNLSAMSMCSCCCAFVCSGAGRLPI
jgi:hypothetical protein